VTTLGAETFAFLGFFAKVYSSKFISLKKRESFSREIKEFFQNAKVFSVKKKPEPKPKPNSHQKFLPFKVICCA